MNKFKKPQFQSHYTPEDAYNEIFNAEDLIPIVDKKTTPYSVEGKNILFSSEAIFVYNPTSNDYTYNGHSKMTNLIAWATNGERYKPHQLLYQNKFKGDYEKARQFIVNKYLNADSKYIRVGVKYFKEIEKENRYNLKLPDIVIWNKDAIIDDYGKPELKRVRKYDDFTVHPDNLNYQSSVNGFYNLYKAFVHKPHPDPVNITEIPHISALIHHIFGEQQELAYQYLKIMYEEPTQILPVLCLVSKPRETGKTTFLKLLANIFTGNFDVISSDNLSSSFNSAYAYLNIIGVDETVIEKQMAVERIKMLSTADTIMVNMKNVQEFSVPFFGKLVLCTNKETDFMRIDSEEIRFWIRKPGLINKKDPDLMQKMISEIPKFLRYLRDLDSIPKLTRMVFTAEQLNNKHLDAVKAESKSGLHKEIEMLITDFFHNETVEQIQFSAIDLKTKWFDKSHNISAHYIRKVLQDEMGLVTSDKVIRYQPFNDTEYYAGVNNQITKTGKPYTVNKSDFNIGFNKDFNKNTDSVSPSNLNNIWDDEVQF